MALGAQVLYAFYSHKIKFVNVNHYCSTIIFEIWC